MTRHRFPRETRTAVGRFTRDAAGDYSVTGVGFRPAAVLFIAVGLGGTYYVFSIGMDNRITPRCIYAPGATQTMGFEDYSILVETNASNFITGKIKSMDVDGFTITFSLTGSETAYIRWMAIE